MKSCPPPACGARAERVTADDIGRVMARHVDPARLTTLVVGDLDTIGADLPTLGLGEPVILSPENW